jgi:hypothetical protein
VGAPPSLLSGATAKEKMALGSKAAKRIADMTNRHSGSVRMNVERNSAEIACWGGGSKTPGPTQPKEKHHASRYPV